jgi:hypothetical protein
MFETPYDLAALRSSFAALPCYGRIWVGFTAAAGEARVIHAAGSVLSFLRRRAENNGRW